MTYSSGEETKLWKLGQESQDQKKESAVTIEVGEISKVKGRERKSDEGFGDQEDIHRVRHERA